MDIPKFTMPFDTMTIEHLGLRLYSTLPPVIGELVSNAYDAESPKVEIQLPGERITGDSEVVIRDFGHGMSSEEIQNEFLPIGRNRRGPNSEEVLSKNKKVVVTGRKGLGKLSAFGVAGEIDIRAIKNGTAICLRLNYQNMLAWAKNHPASKPYEPTVVKDRTGATSEKSGVEVRLRLLHRKKAIGADALRRGIARRLSFIGPSFLVLVDGEQIQPGDRVQREECAAGWSWDVAETPLGVAVGEGRTVRGWVGFLSKSSQVDRGIDIFASKKAVELSSFFNYSTTHVQFARAHLAGEIHADFLDQREDLAATARNSVVWESETGLTLQDWGQKVLRWAFEKWLELRRKEKEQEVITAVGFDKWLKERDPREQRVANRMVKLLVDDPDIDPKSAGPLLEIVKSSVETVAFRELIETLEEGGSDTAALLRLFEEWRIIEAREHLRLADGRLEVIGKLDELIKRGALEVQAMQPLLEKNLWLIDPTWTEATGQTTYTELLRKHCKEPSSTEEKDRRLDILGVKAGGGVTVVEIKRPDKTLTREDLDQIEKYVDWARSNIGGTASDSPKYINGLLVVGRMSGQASIQKKMERLQGDDIRVETYDDMSARSKEWYDHMERHLEKVAPEYARKRRQKKEGKRK